MSQRLKAYLDVLREWATLPDGAGVGIAGEVEQRLTKAWDSLTEEERAAASAANRG